ncbi:MAG: Flp pilus assembly complex ATPase component TadA [Oscillospiraceae bacterium]|nr:Flp pilus assembly complex ATPase component TadA [Oscillospiraceae bacterium]
MARLRLGDLLVEDEIITQQQLETALAVQKADPDKRRLGEVLIETGILSEDTMKTALSKHLNQRYAAISDIPINVDAVGLIPKAVATKYCLISAYESNGVLTVLVDDPLDFYALEDVKLIVSMALDVVICKKEDIVKAIYYWYSEIETKQAAQSANLSTAGAAGALAYTDLSESADDTPVVTLVNSTLFKAHNSGASDIHIEPFDQYTMIRIRIDGQIVEYLQLSQGLHNSIVARIKILANLDIAEKRAPQDGHFRSKLQGVDLNVRVSTIPTIYGEKIVMRFLSQSAQMDNAGTFGMEPDDYEKMINILRVPHGLIYVTGPTGSGKTTTLYMVLEMLSKKMVNIATIEDPVEKNLERINQTQINPAAGVTFESGLRSILRQDPDIIMIGETRDNETAVISVRSALTGHLVLSTLHTNDAVSAVVRLSDMGVESYLLANSLVGVVAQRLVKKICAFCKERYYPSESELFALPEEARNSPMYRGKGCHNCNNTGYKGRLAIHEILTIDNEIREMISKKAPTEDIYEYCRTSGKMKALRASLAKLVANGTTSLEELFKLTYYVE